MPTPGSGDPRDGLKIQVPRKGRHAAVSGAQGAPGRAGAVPAQEVGPPAREAGTGHVPCPGLGPCSGQGRSASEGTSARHSPMSSPALPTPWGRPLRTPALVLLWTVQCGVVWGLLSVPHVPGSLDSFPSRKTWLRAPGLCQGHSWRQARVQFCPSRQGWEVGAVGWGASGVAVPLGTGGAGGRKGLSVGGSRGAHPQGSFPGPGEDHFRGSPRSLRDSPPPPGLLRAHAPASEAGKRGRKGREAPGWCAACEACEACEPPSCRSPAPQPACVRSSRAGCGDGDVRRGAPPLAVGRPGSHGAGGTGQEITSLSEVRRQKSHTCAWQTGVPACAQLRSWPPSHPAPWQGTGAQVARVGTPGTRVPRPVSAELGFVPSLVGSAMGGLAGGGQPSERARQG